MFFFFFQAEDGIRDYKVTGVQTCALPIFLFFWHAVGNNFLTLVSNMFTNLNLTDMETCYKMVRGDLLKRLPLTAERFGIEVELTARLAQAGARIWELPISYSGRTYAEGKKITWRDGLAAMFHILRDNLFPPRGEWRERQAPVRPPG